LIKSDIKWVHVEASTKCNAWCPACPRNQSGFGLATTLVEEDLTVDMFKSFLSEFTHLEGIQFCGNYGDPIANNQLIDLIELAKQKTNKIQIHTNGGLRSVKWWQALAQQLANTDHDVWFGIDGTGPTHEIYRQGTSYDKVIENARAFIDAGGTATWQFIPYAHNEHELKECIKLSQMYKFKSFKVIKGFRNNVQEAYHWKTGEPFLLEPSNLYKTVFQKLKKGTVKKENCMHLEPGGIYLGANGKISPCCYMSEEKTFDTVTDLLYNVNILDTLGSPYLTCLKNCGS
jgi:MoaA/NifB/PqqE/SkfB family radical SAM enzyme